MTETSNIICATCNSEYKPIAGLFNQAIGCASEIDGNICVGFYGTKVIDGEVWMFDVRPKEVKDGVVCDACIKLFKERKYIRFVRQDLW